MARKKRRGGPHASLSPATIAGVATTWADYTLPAWVADAQTLEQVGDVLSNTRASAQTITDYEGLYRQASNNELCWNGLRRQHNSTTSGRFNAYVAGGAAGTNPPTVANTTYNGKTCFSVTFAAGAQTFGNSNYSANHASGTLVSGRKYLGRLSVAFSRVLTAGENVKVRLYSNTGDFLGGVVTIDSTHAANTTAWKSLGGALTAAGAADGTVATWSTATLSAPITVYITEICLYHKTGSAETCAGEIVSIGVDAVTAFNSGVDGIRYYSMTNGNTLDANGIITEGTGTAISNTWTGLSAPQTATNRKTYSEDMDAAGWTLLNATAPDDGTLGPDAIGQLQKFTDDATNAEHSLYGSVDGGTTATMHTKGFHVKAGTLYGIVLRVGSDANYGQAEFRFSDMSVVTTASLGTGTVRNAWIERIGLTDIYRIQVCATFSSAILGQAKVLAAQSAGVTSYAGTSQYCYLGFTDFLTGHDSLGPYIPNKSTGTTSRSINTFAGTLPAVFAANGNMTMVVKFKPFFHTAATWKQEWYDNFRIGNSSDMIRSFYADKSSSSYIAQKFVSSVGTTVNGPAGTQVRLQQVAVVSGLVNNVHKMSVDGTAVVTSANSDACPNAATFGCGDAHGLFQRIEFWARSMPEAEMRTRSTP